MKSLPMNNGRVIAKGTSGKGIVGVSSTGTAQTTSSTVFKEFFVPDGEDFNAANMRIGNPRPTNPDPDVNYENFLWCDVDPVVNTSATILAFNNLGKGGEMAQKSGESLGFFKSTTDGQSVVLWKRE